tara:strand:- start:2836 stop:5679 length:2844 start_codon:yes stop_codon:yes gene_type:complete
MNNNGHNYNEVIKKYIVEKGSPHTHTKIGNIKKNIYGNIYNIENSNDESSDFYNSYVENIIINNNDEFLTEKQLINDGPLLVDIDLRYENIEKNLERQYKNEHIMDLIFLYADKLSVLYNIKDKDLFNVYVLEKENPLVKDNIIKDGIHLIFTIKIDKATQVIMRSMIINEIGNIWGDLNISNTYEDVFDIGITKGYVNWQLYGSKKPDSNKYTLTKYYTLTFNESNDYWDITTNDISNIDWKIHFKLISARYNNHIEFEINKNSEYYNEIEIQKKNLNRKYMTNNDSNNNTNNNDTTRDTIAELLEYNVNIYTIIKEINKKSLELYINNLLKNNNDYELVELYKFLMILPEEYYNQGSYNNWIRVGWALKNTKLSYKINVNKLFILWIDFSSKSEIFDFNEIEKLYNMWKSFDLNNPDGLTHRSIMYWAKLSNYKKYQEIRKETISYYIEQTILKITDCGLADVLYQLYKDQFICVSIKNNGWYECKNGRWLEIDSGNTLRMLISKKMHDVYLAKAHECIENVTKLESQGENTQALKERSNVIGEICMHLKTTSWKNNIMKEAKELFYDNEFIEKLDSNPYLLSFNNYVIDFKKKEFRLPKPDDYISKSTNIEYIDYNKFDTNQKSIVKEIEEFMKCLFPDKSLEQYMWEHLASTLIGNNQNQSFNIYTGSGRNGKSKLVELMSKVLGNYKATIPITLITQNRNGIGSASPEIAQLVGVRYAVMQEPQKGDKINEGIMKEITGGDPIQGRALFKDTITFIPQFKLVCCTNFLFDIKTNDDGTWRRIRVCDFMSKFLDNPYNEEKFPKENFPYQYKIDRNIDEKFNIWAPIFASMLVNIAFKTNGLVNDCKMVLAVSDNYREKQDYLSEFAKEKINRKINSKIKKTEILEEFKNWYIINYGRNNIPNGREITEYMDKTYGKCNRGKWMNVEIIYDDMLDDDDDLNNI